MARAPDSSLALVANRGDGTVTVLEVKGTPLSKPATLALGKPDSGPSGVVFTPDGMAARVTRDGDSFVSVLRAEGQTVEVESRTSAAGVMASPAGLHLAAVLMNGSNKSRNNTLFNDNGLL